MGILRCVCMFLLEKNDAQGVSSSFPKISQPLGGTEGIPIQASVPAKLSHTSISSPAPRRIGDGLKLRQSLPCRPLGWPPSSLSSSHLASLGLLLFFRKSEVWNKICGKVLLLVQYSVFSLGAPVYKREKLFLSMCIWPGGKRKPSQKSSLHALSSLRLWVSEPGPQGMISTTSPFCSFPLTLQVVEGSCLWAIWSPSLESAQTHLPTINPLPTGSPLMQHSYGDLQVAVPEILITAEQGCWAALFQAPWARDLWPSCDSHFHATLSCTGMPIQLNDGRSKNAH